MTPNVLARWLQRLRQNQQQGAPVASAPAQPNEMARLLQRVRFAQQQGVPIDDETIGAMGLPQARPEHPVSMPSNDDYQWAGPVGIPSSTPAPAPVPPPGSAVTPATAIPPVVLRQGDIIYPMANGGAGPGLALLGEAGRERLDKPAGSELINSPQVRLLGRQDRVTPLTPPPHQITPEGKALMKRLNLKRWRGR
jgi:hypothetical protein